MLGFLVSALAQGNGIHAANKGGYDYVTGLTSNTKAVVDAVYEARLAKATGDGQKISKAEKNRLYNKTVEDLGNGKVEAAELETAYRTVSLQDKIETVLTANGIKSKTAAALAQPMAKAVVQDYRMTDAEVDLLSQNPAAQELMRAMNDTFATARAKAQAQAAESGAAETSATQNSNTGVPQNKNAADVWTAPS